MKKRLSNIDYDKFPDAFKDVNDKIVGIEYSDLPGNVKEWIKEHPYQTAFYIVNGIAFIAPGLVATPLLGLMGFGSLGPRAAMLPSLHVD